MEVRSTRYEVAELWREMRGKNMRADAAMACGGRVRTPCVAGDGMREVAEPGNTVLGWCNYSAQIHHPRGTAVHYTLVSLMAHETRENRVRISLAAIFKNYLGVDVSPLHAHECHLSYRTRHSLPYTAVKDSTTRGFPALHRLSPRPPLLGFATSIE